jgi:hypothetical protein
VILGDIGGLDLQTFFNRHGGGKKQKNWKVMEGVFVK